MRTRTRTLTVAGLAVAGLGVGAALATGAGTAFAGGDENDVSVTGRDADRATEAALRATGGGRANSVERDSEDGATWEVEVTEPDGDTVDVRLDEDRRLVVIEGDSEDANRTG